MRPLPRRDRRDAILAAARKALARRGFLGTRAQDIAGEAGVSVALLFRYFPTLRDLQRAVIERGSRRPPIPWPKGLHRLRPRAAIQAAAAAVIGAIDRDPDSLRLALFGALSGNPDSALPLWRDLLRAERGVASLLRACKGRPGMAPGADATGLSRLLVSAWMGDALVRHLFKFRSGACGLNRMAESLIGVLAADGRAEGGIPPAAPAFRRGSRRIPVARSKESSSPCEEDSRRFRHRMDDGLDVSRSSR